MSQQQSSITSLRVELIRFVAHTEGPVIPGGQLSQNHWSLYLLVHGGSVRLNMAAQEGTDVGKFTVTRHAYTQSNSAVRLFDYEPMRQVTVGDVLGLVREKNRHQYTLTPTGVGCRFWIQTLAGDMANSQYLKPEHQGDLCNKLKYNYSRGQEPILLPMIAGSFPQRQPGAQQTPQLRQPAAQQTPQPRQPGAQQPGPVQQVQNQRSRLMALNDEQWRTAARRVREQYASTSQSTQSAIAQLLLDIHEERTKRR